MNMIMQELYYGNIRPGVDPGSRSTVSGAIAAKFQEQYNALSAALQEKVPEEIGLMQKMMESHTALLTSERRDMFETGFTLGSRLMLETLHHDWT